MNSNSSAAGNYGVVHSGNDIVVEPHGLNGGVVMLLLVMVVGCSALLLKTKH